MDLKTQTSRDGQVAGMFFDAVGYTHGSFREGAVGEQFRRELPRFEGRSRLDLVRAGQLDLIRQDWAQTEVGGS